MQVADMPIGSIKPYPKNPRRIGQAAIEAIAASIQEFGWRQPIVVDDKMVIIAGHGRHAAALHLGLKKVPVHIAKELSAKQARALRLADNRVGELAEWDFRIRDDEIQALMAADEALDLSALGFTDIDLSVLIDEPPPIANGLADDDDVLPMQCETGYTAIRYYGGKGGTTLPHILPLIEKIPHKSYCEPFFGMGGVFFNKPRVPIETINDLDGEIVNFFKCLRDEPDELIRLCKATPYAREEFEKCIDATGGGELERARRTIFLILSGHQLHHQTNKGQWARMVAIYRVQAMDRWKMVVDDFMPVMCERLRNAQIENKDALKLMEEFDKDDVLFYLDPPYEIKTRTTKKAYAVESSPDFQIALCERLNSLAHAKFIMSGYDCELYKKELRGFKQIKFKTYATPAASGSRTNRIESLWTNADV